MPNHRSNTLLDNLKIEYKQVMEDLHILENENTEALYKFKDLDKSLSSIGNAWFAGNQSIVKCHSTLNFSELQCPHFCF